MPDGRTYAPDSGVDFMSPVSGACVVGFRLEGILVSTVLILIIVAITARCDCSSS